MMKKITNLKVSLFIGSGLLLLSAGSAFAKQVPESDAKKVAENFFQTRKAANASVGELSYTAYDGQGHALYYAYSMNNNSGFVIISAEDAASPVIGYSTEQGFQKPATQSPAFAWMTKRESEIKTLREKNSIASAAISAKWNQYLQPANTRTSRTSATANNPVVGPLLLTTWNQSPFYNDSCPGGSVTGCVATTMAQIMKYWGYPTQGSGSSSYCDCASSGFANTFGTLKAHYGSATYNWNNMPLSINTHNSEIAKLMYHCGVSVHMNYDPAESGASVISQDSPFSAQNSYVNYFKYDPNIIMGVYRASYSDPNWTDLLKGDLDIGRPVQYAGFGNVGGHTWVCDGYDDVDFFHMNWGWGGSYNGYFSIDNLNPGTSDFSNMQQAIFGIVPMASDGDDAGVVSVSAIANCSGNQYTPVIKIRNNGNTVLSACSVNYVLDNGTMHTIQWTGSLVTGQTEDVTVNALTLASGLHTLNYSVSDPNYSTDVTASNDGASYSFSVYGDDELPVVEGFETPAQTALHWQVMPSTGGANWSFTSQAFSGGAQSMMINNLGNTAAHTSILQGLNNYDFSTVTNPLFHFKVAYQQKATTNIDKLLLQISNDCGKTWFTKWSKQGAALATTNVLSGSAFVPTPADFVEYSIVGVMSKKTVFRWVFISDDTAPGNNLYLDDINLGGDKVTGIRAAGAASANAFDVFPNPANGEAFLKFSLSSASAVAVQVADISGRNVINLAPVQYNAGEQVVSINKEGGLSNGIYIVTITSNGVKSSHKLVIN